MQHVEIHRVADALRREFPDAPGVPVAYPCGERQRWQGTLGAVQQSGPFAAGVHRLAFGLPLVPAPDEALPLVLSARGTRFGRWKGIRHSQTNWDVITGLRAEAIAYARATGRDVDERELKRFANTSTLWLRHSYAKGLAEALKHGLDAR